MHLTQGMFGSEFRSQSPRFGIACGQMRGDDLIHNGGWYNKEGEKLGWGDLSFDDLLRIAIELEEGEYFVILSESDSFWRFTETLGDFGWDATTKPSVDAPGANYVAAKAMYIIGPCRLILVNDWELNPAPTRQIGKYAFPFEQVTRETAKALLVCGSVN